MTLELLNDTTSAELPAYAPARAETAEIPVLHVINGEHYAGAERVQDLLGQRLRDFGYAPAFACLKRGQFAAMRASSDAPLHDVAMRHRFDLSPAWRLAGIVRSHGYRILHTHTARSAFVGRLAAMLTGVPLVHHVHSPTKCDTTHRLRNWINGLVERAVLPSAKALIAVSEALGGMLHAQGFAAFVVPNGVSGRRSVPLRDATKPDWTLGVIALFRPRKGLEVLLDALADLRSRGLPVRLRAVGCFETPDYERQIKDLAHQRQLDTAIDWVGFVRDIDAEMARMDLFVLPSLFGEGLPMVVLEAMSAGLPVVASAVPGLPEAIRDGIEGLLVEPSDPNALSAAIGRFLSGEVSWKDLGAAARLRHAECFSDVRMARDVARIYDRVLGITR